MTFAVVLERHGAYDFTRDLREQDGWDEHAAFMDALTAASSASADRSMTAGACC
jgi:DNA-binding GntR family transcriptional regulator